MDSAIFKQFIPRTATSPATAAAIEGVYLDRIEKNFREYQKATEGKGQPAKVEEFREQYKAELKKAYRAAKERERYELNREKEVLRQREARAIKSGRAKTEAKAQGKKATAKNVKEAAQKLAAAKPIPPAQTIGAKAKAAAKTKAPARQKFPPVYFDRQPQSGPVIEDFYWQALPQARITVHLLQEAIEAKAPGKPLRFDIEGSTPQTTPEAVAEIAKLYGDATEEATKNKKKRTPQMEDKKPIENPYARYSVTVQETDFEILLLIRQEKEDGEGEDWENDFFET